MCSPTKERKIIDTTTRQEVSVDGVNADKNASMPPPLLPKQNGEEREGLKELVESCSGEKKEKKAPNQLIKPKGEESCEAVGI